MKDGFIKAAAAVPVIKVADPVCNAERIIALYKEAVENGAKIIVFPELCITGYTCHDLFLQDELLRGAAAALEQIAKATEGDDALVSWAFRSNGKESFTIRRRFCREERFSRLFPRGFSRIMRNSTSCGSSRRGRPWRR